MRYQDEDKQQLAVLSNPRKCSGQRPPFKCEQPS